MKILQDGKEITQIDFGVAEVGLGITKEMTLEVKNDSEGKLIDLVFTAEGVDIVESPKELAPNAVGKLLLKWTPTLEFKRPLKTALNVSGKEVY